MNEANLGSSTKIMLIHSTRFIQYRGWNELKFCYDDFLVCDKGTPPLDLAPFDNRPMTILKSTYSYD